MSEVAIATLRELWKDLEFFTVAETTVHPAHMLHIELLTPGPNMYPDGTPIFVGREILKTRYLSQVPPKDQWRTRVLWRRYEGVTIDGVLFDSKHYHALNWLFDAAENLLNFGTLVNQTTTYERPKPGQLICGIIKNSSRGEYLNRWFTCDQAFLMLTQLIREKITHTEEELAHYLLTEPLPDTFWALARLVFFDNVAAFVDCLRLEQARVQSKWIPRIIARHPAYGKTYGSHQQRVTWDGMQCGANLAQVVHELSYTLHEPRWWETFLELTARFKVPHSHPTPGNACQACRATMLRSEKARWPYQSSYRLS